MHARTKNTPLGILSHRCNHFQVTLPDGSLPRWRHSITAVTLCPGLVDVVVFGGCPDDFDSKKPAKDHHKIAETSVITFSE